MKLENYLMEKLNISLLDAKDIISLINKYNKKHKKKKLNIKVPTYTLGEELFNSISHGIGALLAIAGLVLMVVKAHGALEETTVSLFGATMIILYTISCIYHALSPKLEGKKVLRVIDHCNVFLLVLGTYIPMSLLGIGGVWGWIFFGVVTFITVLGIIFTSINVDKNQVIEVICHLINGWSCLIVIPKLLSNMGIGGVLFLILGGVMYTLGSILYGIGSKKKYIHCVFHLFCLLGTFFHFWCVFNCLI